MAAVIDDDPGTSEAAVGSPPLGTATTHPRSRSRHGAGRSGSDV